MQRSRRLALALCLDLFLVVVEAVGAVVAHSAGLASTAGHDLADAAALGLALVATRLAMRPATRTRSFGYHRATILAALVNAAAVVAVGVGVVGFAAYRLANPAHVQGGLMIVFAGAGLVGNALAALALRERSGDLNMRAAALHLGGDAAAALGVVTAGAVIVATGRLEALDPAVALAVAVLIAAEAWRIVHASLDVLLESTPADLDLAALAAAIAQTDGVTTVHDLHCWSLSSDFRAVSAHVVLDGHPTLEQAQVVAERVKASICGPFKLEHATLEMECEPCEGESGDPCAVNPAFRAIG